MRQLELGNANNWGEPYIFNVSAMTHTLQNGKTIHTPIGELVVPYLLEKSVYAVLIETNIPVGSKWRFAGFVKQAIRVGIMVGGGQDASDTKRKPLFLNTINIVFLEKLSPEFSLSLIVPDWFTSVTAYIWEYIGTDSDSLEDAVLAIGNQLLRTDQKVNNIEAIVNEMNGGQSQANNSNPNPFF